MSAEAITHVRCLLECPDGAPLNCAQKCVLFCLAVRHNRSTRRCKPSLDWIVAKSLTSEDTVQRSLAYLERHGVIRVERPQNQGRGKCCTYTFLGLEATNRLVHKLGQMAKGPQAAPPFSPPETGGTIQHREAVIESVLAVRRWGSSRCVVITRRVQKQLSWTLRDVVHVAVENDAIVVRPVRVIYGREATAPGVL